MLGVWAWASAFAPNCLWAKGKPASFWEPMAPWVPLGPFGPWETTGRRRFILRYRAPGVLGPWVPLGPFEPPPN